MDVPLTEHTVHVNRRTDPFKRFRAEVLRNEEPMHQAMRRRTDNEGAGRGNLLNPRRDIRCFADNRGRLAPRNPWNVADDHQSRMNSDSNLHLNRTGLPIPMVERLQFLDSPESGTDRPLGVVFMSRGIAENKPVGRRRDTARRTRRID